MGSAPRLEDDEGVVAPSALTPRRVLLIFRRQWWIVAVCVILAGLGGFGYTTTQTTKYAATAIVEVSPLGAVASGTVAPPLPDIGTEIKSPSVVDIASLSGNGVQLSASSAAAGTEIDVTATGPRGLLSSKAALAAAKALAALRIKDIGVEAAAYGTRISALTAQLDALDQPRPSVATRTHIAALTSALASQQSVQTALQVAADSIGLGTTVVPPFQAIVSSRTKVLEVALVAGLLLGCGIALVFEQLDDRLRSSTELSEVGNVGLLAELPTDSTAGKGASIVANPQGELSEAARELRTALRFLAVDRPLRNLLVTSPAAGDGKSFVAVNLAVAFALSGVRTVLVSSDLRRPTLEQLLGTPASTKGLSDAIADAALSGRSSWMGSGKVDPPPEPIEVGHLLHPTQVDGLSLLPAGASPPNPAELLGSVHMAAVLEDLNAQADVVILDSPPVLAVTDALVLTAHVDGVILVLTRGKTSRAAGRRALRLLDSGLAPVMGVVMNRSEREHLVRYPYFRSSAASGQTRRLRRALHHLVPGSARRDHR